MSRIVPLGGTDTITVQTKYGPVVTSAVFTITDSNPGIVSYSTPVSLAAGEYYKGVTLTGLAEGTTIVSSQLTELDGVPITGDIYNITVEVLPISSLVFTGLLPETESVIEGDTIEFLVAFSGIVGSDQVLTLGSSNPAVFTVPATVTVLTGEQSAKFTGTGVSVGTSIVTAVHGVTTKQATMSVTARAARLLPGVVGPDIGEAHQLDAYIQRPEET
jgi:uncharacterized protein YjdB